MQDFLKFLFGSNLCNHQHFILLKAARKSFAIISKFKNLKDELL